MEELEDKMENDEVLQKTLPDIEVIPVNILGIKKLASKGGVLNRITWSYF